MSVIVPFIKMSMEEFETKLPGHEFGKFKDKFELVNAFDIRTDKYVSKITRENINHTTKLFKRKDRNVYCAILMKEITENYEFEMQFFLWNAGIEEAKTMKLEPYARSSLIDIKRHSTKEETIAWIKENRILNHYKNKIGHIISGVPQEL